MASLITINYVYIKKKQDEEEYTQNSPYARFIVVFDFSHEPTPLCSQNINLKRAYLETFELLNIQLKTNQIEMYDRKQNNNIACTSTTQNRVSMGRRATTTLTKNTSRLLTAVCHLPLFYIPGEYNRTLYRCVCVEVAKLCIEQHRSFSLHRTPYTFALYFLSAQAHLKSVENEGGKERNNENTFQN